MQIKLHDVDNTLTLTDEHLDNDNFVDLIMHNEQITISIDELLSAVHAFEQKRVMRLQRENNYKD